MASPSSITARFGRRRRLLVAGVGAIALALGGSATAWALNGSANSGYRMTTVVRTTVDRSIDLVGTVQPVTDVSTSFQVAGQVSTVNVTVGAAVTASETLASLDPTALTESLASAQSTLESDTAKLTEDENAQTATAAPTSSKGTVTTPTTSPSTSSGPSTNTQGTTSATSSDVVKDQTALVHARDNNTDVISWRDATSSPQTPSR